MANKPIIQEEWEDITPTPINDEWEDITPIPKKPEIMKETLASMLPFTTREFVPGLEPPLLEKGIQASQRFSKGLTKEIPEEPSMQTKIGKISPRSASEFLVSGALDPRSLASFGVSKGAGEAIPELSDLISIALGKRASKLTKKAQDITFKILPPEEKRFELGKTLPEIEETAKVIKPSKTYEELGLKLKKESINPMLERENIYSNLVTPEDRSQLDDLASLIKTESKEAQGAISSERMRRVFDNEVDFLNSQERNKFSDPNFYQQRKEYYQELAKPLYQSSNPERVAPLIKSYERLAKGYQTKLENLNKTIKDLNRKFQGLDLASKRAEKLSFKEKQLPEKHFIEEVLSSAGGGKYSMIASMARNLLRGVPGVRNIVGTTLERETKRISKLTNKAEKAKKISDFLGKVFKDEPTEGILEYLPRKLASRKIAGLLPEPPPGKTIEVPPTSEFQVYHPEFPVRETIKEFPKVPRQTLSKETLRVLARRKRRQE